MPLAPAPAPNPFRRRGRPSKLTPRLHDAIVGIVREGNYVETAAGVCGISVNTIRDWLRRGARERERIERGEPADPTEAPYARFSEAIERAWAQAERQDVDRVAKAEDWRATAWRLERRHPERWGTRERQPAPAQVAQVQIVILDRPPGWDPLAPKPEDELPVGEPSEPPALPGS